MIAAPVWISHYIGKPYEEGARGPSRFDCYGLMATVMRMEYGINVPMWDGVPPSGEIQRMANDLQTRMHGWSKVDSPRPGDGVLLARGAYGCHCGVMVTSDTSVRGKQTGYCLHIREGINVSCERLDRIRGYRPIGFWRYRGE